MRRAMLVSIEFILFDEESRAGNSPPRRWRHSSCRRPKRVAGCLSNFCCTDGKDKRPEFLAMYTAYIMSVWTSAGKLVHSNRFLNSR